MGMMQEQDTGRSHIEGGGGGCSHLDFAAADLCFGLAAAPLAIVGVAGVASVCGEPFLGGLAITQKIGLGCSTKASVRPGRASLPAQGSGIRPGVGSSCGDLRQMHECSSIPSAPAHPTARPGRRGLGRRGRQFWEPCFKSLRPCQQKVSSFVGRQTIALIHLSC